MIKRTTIAVGLTIVTLLLVLGCSTPENQKGLPKEEIAEGFVWLFNGENLNGWQAYRGPDWHVEDGMLIGPSESSGAHAVSR